MGKPEEASRVSVSSAKDAIFVFHPPDGAPSPQDAAPGPVGDRYLGRGEIARGGMGSIESVFDRVLLRTVAMKMLLAPAESGQRVDRFVEEAQITGQLDHPCIVPVYDLGTTPDSRIFFTMKLVSGRTLREVIRELHGGGFTSEDLERVVGILVKVCEAVAFAHSRGVIHRDLKPANIMIGTHGQVYVMDWGLGLLRSPSDRAPAAEVQTTHPTERLLGRIEGTVAYMAPEQAQGRLDAVDERTDIFALGAILYEVLTNRPPYVGHDFASVLASASAVSAAPPQDHCFHLVPPGLAEIAMKAMEADPSGRYPSADALGEELAAFLRGGGWFATRFVDDGDLVVSEGDPADAAYVIVEGTCEVFRERGGHRTLLRTLGPGEAFGETALLSARPRTASVVARGSVVLKVITADALGKELGRSTWLQALIQQLANRFADLDHRRADDL